MLHGIGMDWRVWQAISRRLAPEFHLYLMDLRGHGESDKPEHGYTIAHYAADVEELFVRLDLRDAILVGSSLGGVVAAATELPLDMAAAKVLVDPPLTGGPVRDPETFRTIGRLKHDDPGALAAYMQATNPGTGARLAETMAEMWQEAAPGVIEDVLADGDRYFDIDSSLRTTDQPTLIMQADAEHGSVLTEQQAARVLRLLPHGILTHVPGSGHAIHATNPAQFVELVTDFAQNSPRLSQLQ